MRCRARPSVARSTFPSRSTLERESAPAIAAAMKSEEVDLALLAPV